MCDDLYTDKQHPNSSMKGSQSSHEGKAVIIRKTDRNFSSLLLLFSQTYPKCKYKTIIDVTPKLSI